VRPLLDTHIFLWGLLDPVRLRGEVVAALEGASEVWLSPITIWESLLLAERGRVVLEPDGPTWMRKVLRATAFREAPLTHEVALASRAIALPHQDPADRLLVATALAYNLTLVTADRRILAARPCDLLAA